MRFQARRRQDAEKKNECESDKILRLRSLGCSVREICRSVNASVGSVSALTRKAWEAGLKWPIDLDNRKLKEALYPKPEILL